VPSSVGVCTFHRMKDWNVVVTTQERHFSEAKRLLREYGEVARSDFFNVLLMRVEDVDAFMDALARRSKEDPISVACLGRVTPVKSSFLFQSKDEFERKAKEAIEEIAPELEGKSFYVRMHRRGFKGRISSLDEEQRLDEIVMARSSEAGKPGKITFEDPDAVVEIETIGTQAGMAVLSRDQMSANPFLHPD